MTLTYSPDAKLYRTLRANQTKAIRAAMRRPTLANLRREAEAVALVELAAALMEMAS